MGKKLTTTEWIERAKSIWGDEFDYSKSFYKTRNERIQIICKNCGPLWVPAGNHIQKSRKPTGCNTCNRAKAAKSLTKPFAQMVMDARAIHGNRYEYIEKTYVSARVKMTIVCPIHGEVTTTPDSHINQRHGCKDCGKTKKSQETLAQRYQAVAKRVSKLSSGSVKLIFSGFRGQNFEANFECIIHGKFTRRPIAALLTRHPCENCMNELPNSNKKLSKEDIKKRVNLLNGNFRIDSINGEGKSAAIQLTCLEVAAHNPLATTNMDRLYNRDFACPKCAYVAAQPARTAGVIASTQQKLPARAKKWQKEANNFHKNKFDYSLAEYKDAHSEVVIICPVHGPFSQTAGAHLTQGCRKCADEDLKGRYTHTYFVRFPEEKTKPASIYHVSFDFFGVTLFKIGITTTSIKNRFSMASGLGINYSIIAKNKMELYDAFLLEQDILTKCSKDIQDQLTDSECQKLRDARVGVTELIDHPLNKNQLRKYFQCE